MKTIIKYIFLLAASLSFACSDMLNVEPTTFVSDDVIWKDKKLLDQFVSNIYGNMICGFNRCTAGPWQGWSEGWAGNMDTSTDDFATVDDTDIYRVMHKGTITSQNCPFVLELWLINYQVIRKCNILIENIQTVEDKILTQEEKDRYEAEARFLRAFCYFDLARTFGKAPLITHVQELTDDLLVAPSSFNDIIDFVVTECDTYAGNLEKTMEGDLVGHATTGAFLSLKSRALLYYASPLNNPSGDSKRWEEAAKAAKDVMDLNVYELYRSGENPYYDVQFDKSAANKEYIFERRFGFPEISHNIHMMWSIDATDAGSWNTLYPTQNLVDAYETTNGKLITDPANDMYNSQNPYENRDARFYQSIIYNGSYWEGNLMSMVTNTADPTQNGSCKPEKSKAKCGYGPKKFMEEIPTSVNLYGEYSQSNNWPYFRYAEILLNYAEARNEALAQPDQSVYDAINEVRDRAGQPPLPDNMNQADMRARIKNERRVELLLEEHRVWDLRRWKDGDRLKDPIRGINIETTDGINFTYIEGVVEGDRSFNENTYFLPIPYDEVQKNPLLKD
ncbi:MAG: RagB/SusD family nutrient uptake outer membrane protein [Tannerellaceae bacterium]|nr:RagB/SusD family nutrient uptake outer membrane protein [Tannerellaceae bacterium]